MRLVIGLGNPGARYAATRHNVAWRVLDELARRWRFGEDVSSPPTYVARRGRIGNEAVVVMRPLTFMNRSGEALARWIAAEGGEPPHALLVLSDDVYLPVGSLRLKPSGSSGGHRGLVSLEAALGHRDFARLRVGVGAPASTADLKEHVLEAFGSEEEPMIQSVVQLAADAVESWASEGIERAMNRFNRRVGKEVPES